MPLNPLLDEPFAAFRGLPARAWFSTRAGGVSLPPFHSLNLAYLTADDRENVTENRRRVAAELSLNPDELVIGRQVHGGEVHALEDVEQGVTPGDAIVISRPGTAAMVVAADCLPLVFYDSVGHRGAVAHAGWRGLAAGVIANTINALESLGSSAGNLIVGVGPAIHACCYEVGPEVIGALGAARAEYSTGRGDRAFLDLVAVAARQLDRTGVAGSRIADAGICTRCNNGLFFSARAGEPTGRFA
ncbi:MAG: peptidoglycan editing factor PgeF, partial [Dehalococcoidia bacterium]|nr:peptidoglycan editing factor PgeF [Dehalococcoidia bacterium]